MSDLLVITSYQPHGPDPRTSWVVELPIRTVSGANVREHHHVRARRVKRERSAAALLLRQLPIAAIRCHRIVCVRFTRVAPRMLDSGDNLPSAMKGIRDEVASVLGVSDAVSGGVTWAYSQERGKVREYAVRVTIDVAVPPLEAA